MTTSGYVAAIDGGGTKTVCLVSAPDGTILGRGEGGPANARFNRPERVKESLLTALNGAVLAAGGPVGPIDRVLTAAPATTELIQEALAPVVAAERVRVVHEADMALVGAHGAFTGCVVLAGTGSFARARSAGGMMCHVGGWGVLLGDEGSAYDIGRKALVAVARAADGRGQPTALTAAVLAHWQLDDPYQLKPLVYGGDMTQAKVAAIAPLVARAVRAGDHVATAIFASAGRDLAFAAATAVRGVGLENDEVHVSTAGGVWRAGDVVFGPFAGELARLLPCAVVVKPLFEPVIGGLLMALSDVGTPWSSDVLERIRSSHATAAQPDSARGHA